jgi:hypothetical protein
MDDKEDGADLLIDRYEHVTIIFADVVTWTAIASALQPEQAMRVLDRLFQRFDTLAVSHGVYKVESACTHCSRSLTCLLACSLSCVLACTVCLRACLLACGLLALTQLTPLDPSPSFSHW